MSIETRIRLKKSSTVTSEGKPKLPTPEQLEYGELAVNYAKGCETISLKNSANEIAVIKSYPELRLISESGNAILSIPYTTVSIASENNGSYTYSDETSAVGLGDWTEEETPDTGEETPDIGEETPVTEEETPVTEEETIVED